MTTVDYKCPGSELVLPVDPDPIEWLKVRREGLGGTDAATLMKANSWSSYYKMWADKTAEGEPENDDNDILWFGHAVEPHLRERFTEQTGIKVRRAGTHRSKTHPFMQVNPDGLTSDGGILEIKTTEWFTEAGKEWSGGDLPMHPWWQVQHGLAVTGRSHGWFIALVGRRFHIVGPVERDEDAIALLIETERKFWHDHVITKVEPQIDWESIDSEEALLRFPSPTVDVRRIEDDALPEVWLDAAEDYRRLHAEAAALKKELDALKGRLQAYMGDAELLMYQGQPLLKWGKTSGARYFDKASAIEELAALTGKTPFEIEAAHTKRRADSRSFTVPAAKKTALKEAA